MATVEDVYRKHKPAAFKADRRPSSFEIWSWFFMRISGILLLFLVLIHIFVIHLTGEGVDQVDFAFVADRWDNVGWRSFDWLMLFLSLLHGSNGMRVVINDYVHRPGLRSALKTVLYTLTVVLMIMGTAVLVTFDGSAAA